MKTKLNKEAGAWEDRGGVRWPDMNSPPESKAEKIKRFEKEKVRLQEELERISGILDSLRYPKGQDFNDADDSKYSTKESLKAALEETLSVQVSYTFRIYAFRAVFIAIDIFDAIML